MQCLHHNGCSSSVLNVASGVPQGSVLAPLLFSIYVNTLGRNSPDAKLHFYAEDMVIYCCGPTLVKALGHLQTAFNLVERQLIELKLVLNVSKTKSMIFSNGKKVHEPLPNVLSLQGYAIDVVHSFKYLGVLIDDQLSFKPHLQNLITKLKLKLGFFYCHGMFNLCCQEKVSCCHISSCIGR